MDTARLAASFARIIASDSGCGGVEWGLYNESFAHGIFRRGKIANNRKYTTEAYIFSQQLWNKN